jgi:TRAP-type C4-dicarboxylate transport system permease small subunit
VDFFTHNMKQKTLWIIDAFGSLLVGLFGALVAWRSWAGAMTVKDAGETSMILAWPVWIPQAFMVPGFALLAVAGGYMFVHQLRMAARGRP